MSTRRWRRAAIGAAAVVASLHVSLLFAPAHGMPHDVVSVAFAQVDDRGAASTTGELTATDAPPATDSAPEQSADDGGSESPSNIESVTTTETKLRRVVIGLIAISVLTAVLTLGYARHTSPRRRARAVTERAEARARRLAAAAAVGGVEPSRPAATPPARAVVNGAAPAPSREPTRVRSSESADGQPRRRRRPDPRPQPRRQG